MPVISEEPFQLGLQLDDRCDPIRPYLFILIDPIESFLDELRYWLNYCLLVLCTHVVFHRQSSEVQIHSLHWVSPDLFRELPVEIDVK